MTTFNHFPGRNRDMQDGFERGVWGAIEYVQGAGAIMRVRGTGTVDEEAPVLNTGYGFNVPENYNTECFLVSHGSDTNQKYVMPCIPRDKQRQWPENTGGVQNPVDADRYLEFNEKRAYVKDQGFALLDGALELKDGKLYIRVPVVVAETVTVNQRVITPDVDPGSEDIPGFEE